MTSSPLIRRALAIVVIALGLAAVLSRLPTGAFLGAPNETAAAWNDDLLQDYVSARAWLDGGDPYAPTAGLRDLYVDRPVNEGIPADQRNPHPPSVIVALAPLAAMPYVAARVLWLFAMAAAIATAVALTVRVVGGSRALAGVVGVGCLALPIVQKELSFGNHNGLVILLVVVGWRALTAGRSQVAGAALGAAAALRLVPLFLLIPLLRRRDRAATTWFLGVTVLLSIGPTLILGPGATGAFLTEASPENFERWRAGPANLSVPGWAFRWLSPGIWREAPVDLPWLATLIMVAAIVLVAWFAWRSPARMTGDALLAAVPFMLLASPLTWDLHLLVMLPVVVLVVGRFVSGGALPPLTLMLAIALMMIGTPWHVPQPGSVGDFTQLAVYGLPTYGLVLFAMGDWFGDRPGRARGQAGPCLTDPSGSEPPPR